jgi:hypothetical protein
MPGRVREDAESPGDHLFLGAGKVELTARDHQERFTGDVVRGVREAAEVAAGVAYQLVPVAFGQLLSSAT